MTVIIHLVRHAQGFHNLTRINQQIPDPYLTPDGNAQCHRLCKQFPFHDKITHLVASPMRRTILTCMLSFAPAVSAGKKVIAQPLVQEVSSLPCDIGSKPAMLQAEFEGQVDLGLVAPGWNDKTSAGSRWAPEIERLEERAREARVWLRSLGREAAGEAEYAGRDIHIAVATHGGFLHFLTQDWDGMDLARGTFPGGMSWMLTRERIHHSSYPKRSPEHSTYKEFVGGFRRASSLTTGLQVRVGKTRNTGRTSSWRPRGTTRRRGCGRWMPVGAGDGGALLR